jgi:hypothetical protein
MAVTYERDDVRRRVVVTIVGEATVLDVVGIINRQLSEGAWQYAILYDSRLDTSQTPTSEVRAIVDHVARCITQHGPRGPVAIVTPHPANFGMSRMYSTLGDSMKLTVEVFREMPEAEEWLSAQMTLPS